jgi:hypothetical protein
MKPFDLSGSMHDLNSYWGRVAHFFDMVDLLNVLVSDAELRASQAALADVRAGRAPPAAFASDAQLWRAKRTVDSAIHPDTGEAIPLLFRMSFFMPSNLPITAGMLLSGTGMRQVFWQWLNQSYNAGFNYANRNATVPINAAQMAASYSVAVGVACGMSYGLGQVVNRLVRTAGAQTVVLDSDLATIEIMRRFGVKGFFGDPTRPEMLQAAGLAEARVLHYLSSAERSSM